MTKKRETQRLDAADPTLPTTTLTLDGKEYRLCFDLGALAEAETAINREIYVSKSGAPPVNLLWAMPAQNLASTRIMFAASIRRFHPEVGFAEAVALLKPEHLLLVAEAVSDAWAASAPQDGDEENPIEAGEAPASL